ncbi:MAG: VCBS repeat-containing protein, partial [Acidobacteriota bacterium]
MLLVTAIAIVMAVPGSAAPATEWQAICEHFRQLDHPYFGGAAVARLRGELSQAADGPSAHALRLELGERLTQEGAVDEAIGVFEPLVAIDETLDDEQRIRLHAGLALAHLQAGENLNCRLGHTGSACIVPFDDDARHRRPDHARAAADWLAKLVALDGSAARWAWLANVAALATGDWPDPVPESARLRRSDWAGEPSATRWPNHGLDLGLGREDLAGAAILDDFDGDGRLDLVSTTWDPCGPARAYRQDGLGGFEDVSAAWGLAGQLGGLNAIHGDLDGDGRLDLLILRGGWLRGEGELRNSLLLNRVGPNGVPRFVDVTRAAGLGPPAPTQTAALGDIDGDGDLDLFVGNESTTTERTVSQLFRNDGVDDQGVPRLVDITAAAGVANLRYAKGAAFGDVDNDGDPDLYVSNLGANRLYLNQGDGTFVDHATTAGVDEPSGWSFAVAFFDLENDGDLDLFVADYGSHTEDVAA